MDSMVNTHDCNAADYVKRIENGGRRVGEEGKARQRKDHSAFTLLFLPFSALSDAVVRPCNHRTYLEGYL